MKKLNGKQLEEFANLIATLPSAPNGTEIPQVAEVLEVNHVTYGKTDDGHTNFVIFSSESDETPDEYWTIDLMEECCEWNTELSRALTDIAKNRISHTKWVRADVLSNMLGYDGNDEEHGVFVRRLQSGEMIIQVKHYDEVYDFNMMTFLNEYTYESSSS